ncbi:MAG: hypothetical protein JNJ61_24705 [Anaerolineae bacterium]|nr:hypothetical protein [Anaerolineae bacterium]
MYDKPKGKRKDRQPLPWWALALILLLGAGVLIWAVATNRPSGVNDSLVSVNDEALYATATYVIEQATAQAAAADMAQTLAPEAIATLQANLSPIQMTATYIVEQATAQAVQPGS